MSDFDYNQPTALISRSRTKGSDFKDVEKWWFPLGHALANAGRAIGNYSRVT